MKLENIKKQINITLTKQRKQILQSRCVSKVKQRNLPSISMKMLGCPRPGYTMYTKTKNIIQQKLTNGMCQSLRNLATHSLSPPSDNNVACVRTHAETYVADYISAFTVKP